MRPAHLIADELLDAGYTVCEDTGDWVAPAGKPPIRRLFGVGPCVYPATLV